MNMHSFPREPGTLPLDERPKKPITVEHELNHLQLQWLAGVKPYVTKQTACKIWNRDEFEVYEATINGHMPKPVPHFGEYCYTLATVMQHLLLNPKPRRGLDFLQDPFTS
jgi:hypothetical protein